MALASLTLPAVPASLDSSVIKPEQMATSVVRVPQGGGTADGIQGSG